MKKLSIVLAILLVAALAFGCWSFIQKGDLDKQVTDLKSQLTSQVSELTKAKDDAVSAAQTAADEAAAALQAQIDSLTDEKAEAQAALDTANAAVADLEAKLTSAAEEAKAEAAKLAEEADAKLAAVEAAAADAAAKLTEEADAKLAAAQAAAEEAAAKLTEEADAKLAAAEAAAADAAAAFQAQIDTLTGERDEAQKAVETVKATVSELEEKLAAAQTAAAEAAAALQDQINALAGEKDEAQKAVENANTAVADLEAKLSAAAEEAKAEAAKLAEEAQAQLTAATEEAAAKADEAIAALTAEKEAAEKALSSSEENAAAVQAQLDELKNLMNNTYVGKTVILHSNDVHGAVDGYAYIAWLRNWLKGQGAEVILADVGDFSQGEIYVSTNKGSAAIEMMNIAGYDVVTLGNHEFDFGYAQLMENLSTANFAAISANVILDETNESALPASKIIETASGLKIAFVGVETPDTATKVNPGLIKDIHILGGDALYASVQAAVDAVKDQADLVIGLTHLGVDSESVCRSYDLLANVTGFDFLLDAHSHTVMTQGENGEPIQSTGTKFAYIGVVVIDNETKQIEKNFLYNTKGMPKDEAVAATAQVIIDLADFIYGDVFANTEVELTGEKIPNRTSETISGDLITDAMVWSVVKEGGIEQAEPNHVIGITNGGGIRATIAAGDITMKDINTMLPFGNTVAVIYVTGAELLEALEASTFCTPDPVGGYPQTSGIEWTLDTTKAFDEGPLYAIDGKEGTYHKPNSIQRVTITAVNGEPFDENATYAVVTNNFCAAGGDTYNAFFRAYNEGSGFDTGIPMDQALMAYITFELNGQVTAEAYGAPQGRLTLISE